MRIDPIEISPGVLLVEVRHGSLWEWRSTKPGIAEFGRALDQLARAWRTDEKF